jgi:hypothetical protein
MPDYKPNQFVRAFAVMALVAAMIAVVAVVITSNGDSGGGDGGSTKVEKGPSKRGRQAIDRGFWIVRSGDTLGKISEATDVDVDVLIQLNPELDPQALLEGQRIELR